MTSTISFRNNYWQQTHQPIEVSETEAEIEDQRSESPAHDEDSAANSDGKEERRGEIAREREGRGEKLKECRMHQKK